MKGTWRVTGDLASILVSPIARLLSRDLSYQIQFPEQQPSTIHTKAQSSQSFTYLASPPKTLQVWKDKFSPSTNGGCDGGSK